MRHRICLSIALVLSLVLVSLASSDSSAKAQQPQRFTADTGIVTLGPNQALRIIAAGGPGGGPHIIQFRRMEYTQAACTSDGVCKLAVASQSATNPISLSPGEAASLELVITTSDICQGVVVSNRRDLRVTAAIINTLTGETISQIIMANTEGD